MLLFTNDGGDDAIGNIPCASNLVGLGGLEKAFLRKHYKNDGSIPLFRAVAVGLFETIPGLMLQPSLFAMTFEHTDETSRKKQLLSLVITWSMTLKMTMGILPGLKSMDQKRRQGDPATFFICGIPNLVF